VAVIIYFSPDGRGHVPVVDPRYPVAEDARGVDLLLELLSELHGRRDTRGFSTERGEKCLGDLPVKNGGEKKDTAQRDSGFFLAEFV